MKNNRKSSIRIIMHHIDNAVKFTKCLRKFCDLAATGGDAELYIRHNGDLKFCGFVAHDLSIDAIEHKISKKEQIGG
jgi:hypothetical protein